MINKVLIFRIALNIIKIIGTSRRLLMLGTCSKWSTQSYLSKEVTYLLGNGAIYFKNCKTNILSYSAIFSVRYRDECNRRSGTKGSNSGFMICTMFLSMWISNTAATAMMVPIGNTAILFGLVNPPFCLAWLLNHFVWFDYSAIWLGCTAILFGLATLLRHFVWFGCCTIWFCLDTPPFFWLTQLVWFGYTTILFGLATPQFFLVWLQQNFVRFDYTTILFG